MTPPSTLGNEKPRVRSIPQSNGQLGLKLSCTCHSAIGQARLSYSGSNVSIVCGASPAGNAPDATAALVKFCQSSDDGVDANNALMATGRVQSESANALGVLKDPSSPIV